MGIRLWIIWLVVLIIVVYLSSLLFYFLLWLVFSWLLWVYHSIPKVTWFLNWGPSIVIISSTLATVHKNWVDVAYVAVLTLSIDCVHCPIDFLLFHFIVHTIWVESLPVVIILVACSLRILGYSTWGTIWLRNMVKLICWCSSVWFHYIGWSEPRLGIFILILLIASTIPIGKCSISFFTAHSCLEQLQVLSGFFYISFWVWILSLEGSILCAYLLSFVLLRWGRLISLPLFIILTLEPIEVGVVLGLIVSILNLVCLAIILLVVVFLGFNWNLLLHTLIPALTSFLSSWLSSWLSKTATDSLEVAAIILEIAIYLLLSILMVLLVLLESHWRSCGLSCWGLPILRLVLRILWILGCYRNVILELILGRSLRLITWALHYELLARILQCASRFAFYFQLFSFFYLFSPFPRIIKSIITTFLTHTHFFYYNVQTILSIP